MKAIVLLIVGVIGLVGATLPEYDDVAREQEQQAQTLKQQEQYLEEREQLLQQEEQRLQQEQSQAHAVENDAPKVIAKKSVEDEEEIQAAEAYEFQYLPESSPDYDSSGLELEPLTAASRDDHADHFTKPKVGYSMGGPLVNIARGAAAQAHNFEKNQPAAAAQAAYVAKNRLGQSAGLSAATAAAAFAGKTIILRGLEQQAYGAHRALEGEKTQLMQAQRAATAAARAAQQATHQVQVITTALNAAQATAQHASAAAGEAAAELAAQTAMVGAAKARLQAIENQLHQARIDHAAARKANLKAMRAAKAARNNAEAAAAHAAQVANDHSHHEHGHDDDHHRYLITTHRNDEEGEAEDHRSELETIDVPVVSSSSEKAHPESIERDASVQVHAASPDYPGAPITLASVSKDEKYDYDSFPY